MNEVSGHSETFSFSGDRQFIPFKGAVCSFDSFYRIPNKRKIKIKITSKAFPNVLLASVKTDICISF